MSHSSNLMTLRNVASQLAAITKSLSDEGLTVDEYCSLMDILHECANFEKYLKECGLTLELRVDEEGHHSATFETTSLYRCPK